MSLDTLLGRPAIEKQPSGLLRITRVRKLTGDAVKAANVGSYLVAYGTADVEHTDAFLIDQRTERIAANATDSLLVQVYQQLANSALTNTNESTESRTFDGRVVRRVSYICKVGQADALKGAIGDTVGGLGTVFQIDVQRGPVAAVVTKFFIEVTDLGFVLSDSTSTRKNGKLIVRNIQTVGAIAATPVGYTLIDSRESNQDGYTVYSAAFVLGDGVIDKSTRKLDGGITQVTWTSIGTRTAPPGSEIAESEGEEDGYKSYSVTTLQNKDGDPLFETDGSAKLAYEYQDLVEFALPGLVDIAAYTVPDPGNGVTGEGIELIQSPPTTIRVIADIFIFFQKTSAVDTADFTYDGAAGLWNPGSWPSLSARYTPYRGSQIRVNEGYRGYCMTDHTESPKTLTASVSVVLLAWTRPVVLGTICAGDDGFAPTHTVTLSGGVPDPAKERLVLDVNVKEAFQASDGDIVFKKTIVVATIVPAE